MAKDRRRKAKSPTESPEPPNKRTKGNDPVTNSTTGNQIMPAMATEAAHVGPSSSLGFGIGASPYVHLHARGPPRHDRNPMSAGPSGSHNVERSNSQRPGNSINSGHWHPYMRGLPSTAPQSITTLPNNPGIGAAHSGSRMLPHWTHESVPQSRETLGSLYDVQMHNAADGVGRQQLSAASHTETRVSYQVPHLVSQPGIHYNQASIPIEGAPAMGVPAPAQSSVDLPSAESRLPPNPGLQLQSPGPGPNLVKQMTEPELQSYLIWLQLKMHRIQARLATGREPLGNSHVSPTTNRSASETNPTHAPGTVPGPNGVSRPNIHAATGRIKPIEEMTGPELKLFLDWTQCHMNRIQAYLNHRRWQHRLNVPPNTNLRASEAVPSIVPQSNTYSRLPPDPASYFRRLGIVPDGKPSVVDRPGAHSNATNTTSMQPGVLGIVPGPSMAHRPSYPSAATPGIVLSTGTRTTNPMSFHPYQQSVARQQLEQAPIARGMPLQQPNAANPQSTSSADFLQFENNLRASQGISQSGYVALQSGQILPLPPVTADQAEQIRRSASTASFMRSASAIETLRAAERAYGLSASRALRLPPILPRAESQPSDVFGDDEDLYAPLVDSNQKQIGETNPESLNESNTEPYQGYDDVNEGNEEQQEVQNPGTQATDQEYPENHPGGFPEGTTSGRTSLSPLQSPQAPQASKAPQLTQPTAPYRPTPHTAAITTWQRNFATNLQTAGSEPEVSALALSNHSEDELQAAGALLMLSRPIATDQAERDEEAAAGRALWGSQTMGQGVEVMVARVMRRRLKIEK